VLARADGGNTQPVGPPTLLEADARWIQSISADGKRVLVSPTGQPYPQGLSLVTRGEPTQVLVANGRPVEAYFTRDGLSVLFLIGGSGEVRGRVLGLARADGTGVRKLAERTSFFHPAGRWLYYTDETDAGFSFYRIEPPEGRPELLDAYSGPYNTYQAVWATTSPNGESIAYCIESSSFDCYLRPAGSAIALKLPERPYPSGSPASRMSWAPDGSWLLLGPCQIVDMRGTTRRLCDASLRVSSFALSPDASLLATLVGTSTERDLDVHLIATADGTDVVLPRPGPADPQVYRPRYEIGFTPDGSRVIAIIGYASFSASVGGGPWTTISSDHGPTSMSAPDWLAISPDSRVIADQSVDGLVESIDGAAPRAIRSPDGRVTGPGFEPAGGLDKAIFFALSENAWLANADGSGDWVKLAGSIKGDPTWCEWVDRTAVCFLGHSDPLAIYSSDVVAVTDDGEQRVILAHDTIRHALSNNSLYFVRNDGGLYVVDGLPQPAH